MTPGLILFAVVAALGALALLLLCRFGGRQDRSEPAADPVDEHFTTAPREDRITAAEADLLVAAFPWGRYSTWLKDPAPEEAP